MSTALYRRYRPETFADVIGQDHVTGPLTAALDNQRVTHAYLFSGPRGCGKTTSARIFARCLNCAEGPTSTPCGTCPSCVDLARGGGGSIDVVEMDAASHGGVDDARELRDRAIFGTARDRYKIFIIDEAHMVTTQGFNALLKLVEEPPAHVKFVFATTEPEKVIGTIRSRTHHYPFRLVPPEQLTEYLQSLAQAEGVQIDSGVLPLVVRAGGGSVRDSLSVLDQLIAGMDESTIDYERAVSLLGFTHATLLDDTVEAIAARDGASLFRVVDRVIDSGHAPRRFVEDLLERLRDLIVVRAAGEHAGSVLRAVPADQLERMHTQATHLGADTLSRDADLVNEALTEMTGATSPRLQLELLCARLLLPGADDSTAGYGARLEWLEGTLAHGAAPAGPPPAAPAAPPAAPATPAPPRRADTSGPAEPDTPAPPSSQDAPTPQGASGIQADSGTQADSRGPDAGAASEDSSTAGVSSAPGPASNESSEAPSSASEPAATTPPTAPPPSGEPVPAPSSEPGELTADHVRRRWPEVLETLTTVKRTTWALISQHAQVVALDASTLQLGFSTGGLASAFSKGGHSEHVQRALAETLGLHVRVEPVVSDGTPPPPPCPESGGSAQGSPGPAAGGTSWEPQAPAPTPGPPPQSASSHSAPPQGGPPESGSPESGSPESGTPADESAAAARDEAGDAAATAPPWDVDEAGEPAALSGSTPESSQSPGRDGSGAAVADTAAEAAGETATAPPTEQGPAGDPPVQEPSSPDQPGPDEQDAPADSAEPGEPDEPDWPSTDWAGGIDPPEDEPPEEDPGEQAGAESARQSGTPVRGGSAPGPAPTEAEPPQPGPAPSAPSPREQAMAAAREAKRTELSSHTPQEPAAEEEDAGDYEPPDPNDPTIESTGLIGAPLVARLLGGTVIDEILDSPEGGDR